MSKAMVTNKVIDRLFAQLRLHNVALITISFEGSGDAGSIEEIQLFDASDNEIAIPKAATFRGAEANDNGRRQPTVGEALENLGYEMLDKTGVDWYNNEGGFGEIHINISDINDITIHCDMNQRFIEVDNSLYEFYDFETIFKKEGVTS